MIRVAILGFWHVHAADYAAEARAHPGMEIVAAWDDDTARGRARAADLDVAFHDSLDDLLARPDVDGVIVTTATNAHPDVITAAAKAGKHVFTEKVLALTPGGCGTNRRRSHGVRREARPCRCRGWLTGTRSRSVRCSRRAASAT